MERNYSLSPYVFQNAGAKYRIQMLGLAYCNSLSFRLKLHKSHLQFHRGFVQHTTLSLALLRLQLVRLYRVGQKSKLLISSEYVNKTENIGGMWTIKNSYGENEVLCDIFT